MSENATSLFALRKKKNPIKDSPQHLRVVQARSYIAAAKAIITRATVKSLTAADLPRFPKNKDKLLRSDSQKLSLHNHSVSLTNTGSRYIHSSKSFISSTY